MKGLNRIITLSLAFVLLFCAVACGEQPPKEDINEQAFYYVDYDTQSKPDAVIDFGTVDGTKSQNLHKVDMFAPTGWVCKYDQKNDTATIRDDLARVLNDLYPLKSESFRIDMQWAGHLGIGYNSKTAVGDFSDPDEAFKTLDTFQGKLKGNNVLGNYVMLGTPRYVRQPELVNQDGHVPDMEKYTEFVKTVSKHFKDTGRRVLYETWNEPDFDSKSYWKDGMEKFINVSVAQAVALKQGDPDAFVGELALCWPLTTMSGYWDYYMQKTAEANNRIDAFTWHYYGTSMGDIENCASKRDNFSFWKNSIRNYINESAKTYDLHTMTQQVTEFSIGSSQGYDIVRTSIIPKMYLGLDYLLDSTDISRVTWAAYFMNGYSMNDSVTLEKRPSYYVLWSNARLPLTQATVSLNEGISDTFLIKTGFDKNRAGAIISNKTLSPAYFKQETYQQRLQDSRIINVQLKNLPENTNQMKFYLIDTESNAGNRLSVEPTTLLCLDKAMIKENATIKLKIPGNAAIYVETNTASGLCETDVKSNLTSHIAKKNWYYEIRADRMPYSDLYETGFNASLGMLDHTEGKTAINVVLDKMNEFSGIKTDWVVYADGSIKGTDPGIGIRVDFHTANGYTYSKNFCYEGYVNGFTYSGFGTGRDADETVKINNDGIIPLKEIAPTGWDGRIQLTYFMTNAGKNTGAKINASGIVS